MPLGNFSTPSTPGASVKVSKNDCPLQVRAGNLEKASVNQQRSALRRQRGEGKLKAIVYTAILVAAIYVAVKLIPPYVADYQLKDKMNEQARFAIVNRYTDDHVRDLLFKVIQDLDIPAKREDIKVSVTNHGMEISVSYTVPVDFMVYKTDLNFNDTSEGIDLMR
jgi:hypothetical protein